MMNNNGPCERHTSVENFDRYLSSRLPVLLPVLGTPEAGVFIDPLKPELGLRIAVDENGEIPRTGLRNLVSRVVHHGDAWYFEVAVTSPALFRDAYPMLCSMADRVQIDGLSPSAALRATLNRLSTLLSTPDMLSREREVGLFGELLTLSGLFDVLGPDVAVQSWRGGQAEEHDFGLPDFDVEIKTTTGERRVHWIESLTQLVPTGARPLWLVSHQVTGAGAGTGHALTELIDESRRRTGTGTVRDAFEAGLSGAGWDDSYRDRVESRWARRTTSTAHLVADGFPRLTPEKLRQAGVLLDRIPDVRYRIDLSGLATSTDTPKIIIRAASFEGWT
jgi:hypothetical protein